MTTQKLPRTEPPALPVQYMTVRALNGAVVYSIEGSPIPAEWTRVPISAGIVNAVKYGDLEEAEETQ